MSSAVNRRGLQSLCMSTNSTSNERFNALCEQIERDMRQFRVPGVAVGVLHDGQIDTAGFGVTHINHPLAVTPDTLFQVGSITKTFVGTAVMRLVEQAKLNLDTPVKTYVPKWTLQDKDAEAGATLRHLLTHTGGWLGDYFDDFGWGDDAIARYVAAMAALPQVTPLGKVYSYNNAGFNLTGRVIEKVTGKPFEEAMAELVIEPLGLDRTFFFPWEAMVHRFATGHISPYDVNEPVGVGVPWPIGRASHPAGGVISSVKQLLKYAQFHMGDGNGVWSAESLAQMKTPQVMSNIIGDQWGLSFAVRQFGHATVIGHGGATKGQMATFQMVPASNFAIAILTNSDRGVQVHSAAVTTAIKLWLGQERPAPAQITLPREQLQTYVGHYDSPLNQNAITLDGDTLVLTSVSKGGFPKPDSPPGPPVPPTRMSFSTPDLAYGVDFPWVGDPFEFLRDDAGHITYMRSGGRARTKIG